MNFTTTSSSVNSVLKHAGMTLDDLRSHIDDAFGEPLLTLLTGSMAQGFGNARSDVDPMIIVDRLDGVGSLPVLSFAGTIRVDTNFLTASGARARFERATTMPSERIQTRDEWRCRVHELSVAVRLATGLVIDGHPQWIDWHGALPNDDLQAAVVDFWTHESVRRHASVRLLRERNVRLAALRMTDAQLADLEVRAAQSGACYFGHKWLAEKLRLVGRIHDALEVRAVLRSDVLAEFGDVVERAHAAAPAATHCRLHWLPGTEAHRVGRRTLVNRWRLSVVEVRDELVVEPGSTVWTGTLGSALETDWLMDLCTGGMLWLSVDSEAAA